MWYEQIPGSFGWPVVGNTVHFYVDCLRWMQRMYARHGSVVRFHILGQKGVALLGEDANRLVLAEKSHLFSSRFGWDSTLGVLFRNGLMLRDLEDHKRHRRILQVAFHRKALVGYLARMEPVIERQLASWPLHKRVRIFDLVKTSTLELAAQVFLGLELDEEVARLNRAFLEVVGGTTSFVRWNLPGTPYARALRARRWLEDFFLTQIRLRQQHPQADLLSHMVHAQNEVGESLTQEEIVDHMIFFLMAAHDTTTSLLTSLFFRLGTDLAWQCRLREEQEAFAEKGSMGYERLRELVETGWAIKETLRLHSPVIVIPRRALAPFSFQGFSFPAGTMVAICPAQTHRMSLYWTEPEHFDPERFSEARSEHKRGTHTYLPFGAGPHVCLGMFFAEMQGKLMLHHILRRFQWHFPQGYAPMYLQVPLQAPANGLPLRLFPVRKNAASKLFT